MAKFNEKLSTILSQQLPEYVVADHPKFADFLKTYYQLLESAKIEVTSVQTTVGILLETETGQENNLVLNFCDKNFRFLTDILYFYLYRQQSHLQARTF